VDAEARGGNAALEAAAAKLQVFVA